MKKINILGLLPVLCIVVVALISCEKEKVNPPVSYGPPQLIVRGIITNEEGLPLQSILVTIDSIDLDVDKWEYSGPDYSDIEGEYGLSYGYKWVSFDMEIPTEIIVSAKDTSGIYETQSKKIPMERVLLFPDRPSQIFYGKATADFVLKKKSI